ncbi:hypothetical protein [Paenibacillus motobuensis]|uniref:Uncharacterized protein n=1 Tax=Paenibacillus motobuensis TaxID=295324 RepID=A0ABN0YPK3_9BACL
MQTVKLTDKVLKSQGWAYQFDLTILANQSDESINEHIRNVYLSAIDTLSKQRSPKILIGPFYLWICQKKLLSNNYQWVDGFALIVTPLFQKVVGRDVNPIVESMWQHKGYLRTETAVPILEGAIPACIFKDGQAVPIELDDELLTRLSDMFEEHQYMLSIMNPGMSLRSNPYK